MKFFHYFILFSTVFIITVQKPQVFKEFQTCTIKLENSNGNSKKVKELIVPSYMQVQDSNLIVLLSLCSEVPSLFPNDGSCKGSTCIYQKGPKKLIYPELSQQHLFTVQSADDEISLLLTEKLKCTNNEFYNITVKMLEESLRNPRLEVDEDDACILTILMMKPNFQPKCTLVLNGRGLIDLRPLRGKKISIPSKESWFKLVLCGGNIDCGYENAVCNITNGHTDILGTASSLALRYDESNKLQVVSSVSRSNRKTIRVTVNVKCNWKVPYLDYGRYIAPSTQGKNYKFEVESSFGCIKLSKSCLIRDEENLFTFDLRGLSNKGGAIVNGTGYKMRLNICGNLILLGTKSNSCSAQLSQVCEIDGNIYRNKGSLSYFEVMENRFVRVHITDGDKCSKTESYSTVVDIKCSLIEKGPVLVSDVNCKVTILWETPKGCPIFESEKESCEFQSYIGNLNMHKLYTQEDKIQLLSRPEPLKYNLCGKIHSNCSSSDKAAACLTLGGVEKVVGFDPPLLSYKNGDIRLKYRGEKCVNNSADKRYYSLSFNAFCSYSWREREIKIIKVDECTFVGDIYSTAACLSPGVTKCYVEDSIYMFDLTALIAREKNHKIRDTNNNHITYYLNACGPLLNQPGFFMHSNSMAYLEDTSQAHLMDRFKSLSAISTPKIVDSKVQIHTLSGGYCSSGVQYGVKIVFECAQTDEPPKLDKIDNCLYKFSWRTKHACPKVKPGAMCLFTADGVNITVPGEQLNIISDHDNSSYEFNLCLDHYRSCNAQNYCTDETMTRRIRQQYDEKFLELTFNHSRECVGGFPIRIARIRIQCDRTVHKSVLEINRNQGNCQVDMLFKTRSICRNDKTLVPSKVDRTDHIGPKETAIQNDESPNVENIKPSDVTKKPLVEVHTISSPNIVEKIEPNYTYNSISSNKLDPTLKETVAREGEGKKMHDVEVISAYTKENEMTDNRTAPGDKVAPVKVNFDRSKCEKIEMNGHKFELKEVKPFEVRKEDAIYVINFNGSSQKCGGLICRNGIEMLQFIENCADVSTGSDFVKFSYASSPNCKDMNHTNKTISNMNAVDILLRCNTTGPYTDVSDSECNLVVTYSSPEICQLFSKKEASMALMYSGVVLVVAVSLISVGIYKKNYCRKSSYVQVAGMERINHSKLL